MDEEKKEEPTIWEKAIRYVRGQASANPYEKFGRLKPNPNPEPDPDKLKSVSDSFKSAK